jgi:hypothetical protein
MNKEELQKNIALYYSKLPKEAQEAFASQKWLEDLRIISLKYSLNGEQIETLATETMLVLLGIISSGEYESVVKTELKLGESTTSSIMEEINSKVLGALKPKLNEAFEANIAPASEEEAKRREVLDERFSKLSPEIQDAISASNYHDTLYKLASEAGLKVADMAVLESITTDTILGITLPDKFEARVKSSLPIEKEKLTALVNLINDQILRQIRNKMMEQTSPIKSTNTPVDISKTPETQIKKSEEFVLNRAGIKIENSALERKPDMSVPELGSGKVEAAKYAADPAAMPIKANPPAMKIDQKFINSVKIPAVKTEHTIDNLTKGIKNIDSVVGKTPKIDPYREIPE